MEETEVQQRLSRISTQWTLVFQAHRGDGGEAVSAAQKELMQRYCGAVYRYLLAAVRDSHTAADLAQEFALSFIRGDFKRADPGKGRFRDYVKTVLFHLVANFHRGKAKLPRVAASEIAEPAAADPAPFASDEDFLQRWREELLSQAWEALARVEKTTGKLYHTVLRFRAQSPDVPSALMAEQLSARLGRPLTAAGVRQTLHRARDRFAELLLDEVACSLETDDPEKLEQELIDLGLLAYCRDALQRRAGGQR